MRISCHVTFDGDCKEAFLAYQKLLGGEIETLLSYSESPLADQVPPEWQSKILHATLRLGDHELMGSDSFPGVVERPQGFCVTLSLSSYERGREVFSALSKGGEIRMQFQKTFWSPGFGVVTDRFGVPWEINCQQES